MHRLGGTTRGGGALLLVLLALGGCDAAPESAESAPAAEGVAEVDLAIGEVEGEAPYMFGRISGAVLDPEGRILVADAQADEVRVFSPEGEYRFAIGRGGSGPGELRSPCCLAWGPDGMLWVRDGGNARYNRYRVGPEAASFAGSVRMAHGDRNFAAPVTFDPEGRLIDVGHQADPESGQLQQVRFHLDSAGAVAAQRPIPPPPPEALGLHTVTRGDRDQRSTFYLWQPFGASHLVAHGPGGEWAEALSSEPVVRWYSPDGTVRHEVAVPAAEGPVLSAAERARAEDHMADDRRRFGLGAGALPYEVPDRKPPLRDLHFDRSGGLWVELGVSEGEPRRAWIYGPDGRAQGRVRWPADVELRDIGSGVALGVTRDSMGVERVVRLRIGGSTPAGP